MSQASFQVSLIGGSGAQGRGLAMRLAMAGVLVCIGSRDETRAQQAAEALNQKMSSSQGFIPLKGTSNQKAAHLAPQVWLTVPYDSAVDTLHDISSHLLPEAIVVDVTVPLSFVKGVKVLIPPQGSGSLALREALDSTFSLCGACKTLPAHVLEDIAEPLNCCDFVYGDNPEARRSVMEVLQTIPTLNPVECGGLISAAAIESMTALLIRINFRYKSHAGRFEVIGVDSGIAASVPTKDTTKA